MGSSLLDDGHSIAEVAYLLGFTESSVFQRAFRRGTGSTPEAFRKRRHDAYGKPSTQA